MAFLYTKTINSVEIAFDEVGIGQPNTPTIVLLPGWCHDMRAWSRLLPFLAPYFHVVRINWRGHGPNRDNTGDFGLKEQVNDTIALLNSLDIDTFIPVSHSHGGWVALRLAQELGKQRVPAVMILDLIMSPPPPDFKAGLQAMQSRETWKAARQGLMDSWATENSHPEVVRHFVYEGGGHGFDMWSRSCRVIEKAYDTWGSPMGLMEKMADPPAIRHCFAHPRSEQYSALHAQFRAQHAWFSYVELIGETHFPGIELPEEVAEQVKKLVHEVVSSPSTA